MCFVIWVGFMKWNRKGKKNRLVNESDFLLSRKAYWNKQPSCSSDLGTERHRESFTWGVTQLFRLHIRLNLKTNNWMYDTVKKEQTDKLMQSGALAVMKEARKYLILLRINFKQKFLIEIIILI